MILKVNHFFCGVIQNSIEATIGVMFKGTWRSEQSANSYLVFMFYDINIIISTKHILFSSSPIWVFTILNMYHHNFLNSISSSNNCWLHDRHLCSENESLAHVANFTFCVAYLQIQNQRSSLFLLQKVLINQQTNYLATAIQHSI